MSDNSDTSVRAFGFLLGLRLVSYAILLAIVLAVYRCEIRPHGNPETWMTSDRPQFQARTPRRLLKGPGSGGPP